MKTVITNDLESILRKPAKSISVGLRPSGNVHLGNLTTVTLAGLIAAKQNAELHLTVCDIDMPTVKRGEETPSALYYKYQPVENTTQAQLSAAGIMAFSQELSRFLGIPVRTDFLSDVQRAHQYRNGLSRILEGIPQLRWIYTGIETDGDRRVPVHPVCKTCNHTPRAQAIYLGKDRIKTRCRNEECDDYNRQLIINVHDKKTELGVHYFIDPIRDVMFSPRADIHVFGGDYLAPHGSNGLPKVEKVRRITELTGRRSPNYFVGPLLQGPEQEKMSKSQGSELTYNRLRIAHEGTMPFAAHMLKFAEEVLRSGKTAVPYTMIMEYFRTAAATPSPQPSAATLEPSLVS